jgi:hypothetical protein
LLAVGYGGYEVIDKYKDDILALITKNGPMGVNALQRELNVPLSTLQKYMHRQRYFRINEDKKWDTPENVTSDIQSNTLDLMVNSVENTIMLLSAQLEEIQQTTKNALIPISTLKRGVKNLSPTVANRPQSANNGEVDPFLLELDKVLKDGYVLYKKYVKVCPEEYQNLISNVDLVRLTVELGSTFVTNEISPELSALFLEKSTTLSEDTIEYLKMYQKGQEN